MLSLLSDIKEETHEHTVRTTKGRSEGLASEAFSTQEKVEAVSGFNLLGSKITADGDCSHEHERHALLERKVMTSLRWGQWLCCVRLHRPHGLRPARLLCPCDSPGKHTAVGCHFLLYGTFLTQGLNSGLLHCRQILYHPSHQGSPKTNLDGVLKSRDVTSPTQVHRAKVMVFPVVMYGCESWVTKRVEH